MPGIDEYGGWSRTLGDVIAGRDLDSAVAGAAMATILAGEATDAQIASFAVAMRAKGESSQELAGMLAEYGKSPAGRVKE